MGARAYARVSTDGQNVDAQVRQLAKAGCKKVFREVASGAKTDRAQLHKLLAGIEGGDVTWCSDTAGLAIACLLMTVPAYAASPPQVIFSPMSFSDTGDSIHVEGTMTGSGVGYENNRTSLTCYQDSRECWVVHVDSQGMQVFSIGPPMSLPVRVWTDDQVVANYSLPCGPPPADRLKAQWQTTESGTWIIDRTRRTAEVILHECLSPRTYHWTVEDPLFWKKAQDPAASTKQP
jgi:hypothetical protein